jgi:Rap1a immunity proteins
MAFPSGSWRCASGTTRFVDFVDRKAALRLKYRAPSDSRRRKLRMRYVRILSMGLIAAVAFAWSAAAIENADELAGYCQSLERGAKGAGRHIYIPSRREALTCWGYMQAMQDLSVLADENGHRIMGACPPEQTTTLQLIRSFIRYASAHRSELPGNAAVVVFRALRGAYPCHAEHGE